MLKIEARAKINLTLDILRKRPDGYHEVVMVMQSVGLSDTLTLEKAPAAAGIVLTCNLPDLPVDEKNLAYRAARLFLDQYQMEAGVSIALEKRIPMAAGLAGGSADAAAVLRGMALLFSTDTSEEELCRMGAKLGSDIPFCICGGTMLAEGRGEKLSKVADLPECWVVLAKPPADVSTAWVYQQYDAQAAEEHPDTTKMLQVLEKGDLYTASQLLCNVLESVTIKRYPEIQMYKDRMDANGALASLMSGSGSTVFCLTEEEETARKIAEDLRSHTAAKVFVTKTVSRN